MGPCPLSERAIFIKKGANKRKEKNRLVEDVLKEGGAEEKKKKKKKPKEGEKNLGSHSFRKREWREQSRRAGENGTCQRWTLESKLLLKRDESCAMHPSSHLNTPFQRYSMAVHQHGLWHSPFRFFSSSLWQTFQLLLVVGVGTRWRWVKTKWKYNEHVALLISCYPLLV